MNLESIEKNLNLLIQNLDEENFIYDFLLAYDQPKATISRLKKGDYNQSDKPNQLIWKKKIFYHKVEVNEDVHDIIDKISKNEEIIDNKIRFIIVTDFNNFLSLDLKTRDTLDIKFSEINKNSHFFLPLIGQEKAINFEQNLADIKAAGKMAKLFDLIIKDNPENFKSGKEKHGLNIFFTRLLFCFFAEDAEIFEQSLFTRSIKSYTSQNGDDLDDFFGKLFFVLKSSNKKEHPEYLKNFPYVNGGLFKNDYYIPKFSKASRQIIIDSGSLDWNSINPDILGSMMQAIVQQGIRQEIGMHYTSVKNILKIIKPLFLDELNSELISCNKDPKKLKKLLKKIYNINIFDPACGSGNFLVISYKELYKIEIEILKQLKELDKNNWLFAKSGIELSQFYGIEIDDYAHETAKLSLWIAQHQMNNLYEEILNDKRSFLPLTPSGNIYCKNANLINWEDICPKKKDKQLYIVGNPPYVGSSLQTKDQKRDMESIFEGVKGFKNLDFISCWFLKGAKYIKNSNIELAFISTKSICQGEQVSMLWPNIFNLGIEIGFCHESFKWSNNAKYNAGVTCVIISLRNKDKKDKLIFKESSFIKVKNINAYLSDFKNIIVKKETNSISNLPKMTYGNKAVDGGNLIISEEEKEILISKEGLSEDLIKPFLGAHEYLHGKKRYCLWIDTNEKLKKAEKISLVKEKFKKVYNMRINSRDKGANDLAKRSHQFRDILQAKKNLIIIPSTTSERRDYIPIGFLDKDTIVSNASHVIYDPPIYVLSLLSSKMHMSWVFSISGYLGSSIRYSSGLSYNTFPFPKIDKMIIKSLEEMSFLIVDEREKYPEKSLAELYDPEKMPKNLISIHEENDTLVEKCYSNKNFNNNQERLRFLFNMYDEKKNKDKLV